MAGPYAIIPEFAKMKLGEGDDADVSSLSVPQVTALDNDPDTLFVYYTKSSGKPLPGKGSGEKIPASRREEFKTLAGVKDWRKKLSNDWIAPIDVDGHQWQTVEHYYQGSKYKKGHPEIYYQFTLDSRSELGKSAERAKKFNDFEPIVFKHLLNNWSLRKKQINFFLAGKPHYFFYCCSVIPTAIPKSNFSSFRQFFNIALPIPLSALSFAWLV